VLFGTAASLSGRLCRLSVSWSRRYSSPLAHPAERGNYPALTWRGLRNDGDVVQELHLAEGGLPMEEDSAMDRRWDGFECRLKVVMVGKDMSKEFHVAAYLPAFRN
jgi:hypothetical protein